jgi:hypothetical protein
MLQTVQIPGYADALRKEAAVRRGAFVHNRDTVAGVAVRQMTVGDMLWLEELRNGFFCPFRFETKAELVGHAAHLVWWLSDAPKPDPYKGSGASLLATFARERMLARLAQRQDELVKGVERYLADTFMDAPKGSGTSFSAPHAAMPASIADILAAGGYSFTAEQILEMPLIQLWQLVRLAKRRLDGTPLTNPSDKIATDYLATLNKQGAN